MKKFKILLFIFIFFIDINIVEADSLKCSYSYVFNKSANLAITFEVIYDGSDIKIEKTISSSSNVTTTTNLPSKLQDTNIRDDNGKLSCPTFYAKTNIKSSGRNVNYDIDFSVNARKDGYDKIVPFDSDIKDTSSSGSSSGSSSSGGSSSGGSSSGSSGNSSGIKHTCVYSDSEKGNVFSFSINNNNKIVDYAGLGSYGDYSFVFSNTDNWSNCPQYIKVNACSSMQQYGVKLCNVEANDSSGTWFHNGSGVTTSGSDKDLIVRYLAYNSKGNAVQILKSSDGYRVVVDNAEITVNNKSDYTAAFTGYDVENYPTWIHSIEDENGKTIAYEFSNSRNELSKVNYICQEKIIKLYGTGKNDPNETCLSLFGEDFLIFLNNNVFTIVRLAIPLLLILFTTFDFAKVIFVDDKDGIQKAGKRFGKRLVAAILIFLIPQILVWLANIIGADKVNECADWLEHNQSTITDISSDE